MSPEAPAPLSLVDLLPILAELIVAQQGEPKPLAEVAARLGQSPGHAQRVFKRLMGESPKGYQRRLQLERGAVLLLATDARIIDVAVAVGFGSHEAFTRAFAAHFGRTPNAYRASAQPLCNQVRADAMRYASTAGPCIRLFHMPHNSNPSKDSVMTHEIEIKSRKAVPFIFQRRTVAADSVASALAEVLPACFGFAMSNGLAMAGPPTVRYAAMTPGSFTIEAGVPLAEDPGAIDHEGIELGELPAGESATTVHKGPYETLRGAYSNLEAWMSANERTPSGAPWETYLTDPGEVPNPADWLTEVVWPLQPAG